MGDEQGEERLADRWFVKALSHPVRVEILELLNEREASPVEMKRSLGGTLNLINYHLKVLVDCGCVEVARTEPVRGAVKHFYRAVPRSFFGHPDLREVPASIRGGATEMALRSFSKAFHRAAEAGNVDGDDAILNWMSLAVDELGREKAIELSETVLRGFELIAKQSRERAAEGEKPLAPLVVAVAAFDAAGGKRRS
ncbi:MAG TPA: winged helix-turn-helix domain-containing protein [Solirubrobacterales bacterium]|nr:winged helix-turn-helix domain-containing protein [Solirubrobacterales bacterium]